MFGVATHCSIAVSCVSWATVSQDLPIEEPLLVSSECLLLAQSTASYHGDTQPKCQTTVTP